MPKEPAAATVVHAPQRRRTAWVAGLPVCFAIKRLADERFRAT